MAQSERTAPAAFVPTWARGRSTRYHAASRPSYHLGDRVRADIAAERVTISGRSFRVAELARRIEEER